MNGSFLTAGVWWVELALAMAVGVGLAVGLAAGVGRWTHSGRAQQALWRVCLLALWGFLLAELLGIGPPLGVWLRAALGLGHELQSAQPVPSGARPQPAVTDRGRANSQAAGTGRSASQRSGSVLPAGKVHSSADASPGTAPTADLGDDHGGNRRDRFPAGQPTAPGAQETASWPDIFPPGDGQPAPTPTSAVSGQEPVIVEFGARQLDRGEAVRMAQPWPPGGPGVAASARGAPAGNREEFQPIRAQAPLLASRTAFWLCAMGEGCGAWVARLWAMGAVVLLGQMAWNRWQLGRLRATLSAVGSQGLEERAGRLARQLGLCRPVTILESPDVRSPVAFGVFRPVLVVPEGFAAEFGHWQQEVILAHELAHLARRDPLWLLACDLLCAVVWWHPAVWIMRRQLRMASELAADESSLLVPGGPEVLAGCLVGMARRTVVGRRLGWIAVEGGGFRSALGRRVERLLGLRAGQAQPSRRTWRMAGLAGLAVLLGVVPVLSTSWVHAQAGLWQGETTMNVLRASWQRWLAALAAAAFLGPAPAPMVAAEHPDAPKAVAPRKEGPHAERPKDAPREGERRRVEREGRPDESPPHLRELMQRRRHLEEQVRDLSAALERARPDSDDARELRAKLERVRRELGEVAQQLRRRPDRAEPPPIPLEERERRMHHLRIAAENLRAAGMHELAERLLRGAEGRPGMPGLPPGPPGPQPPELARALHDLAAQVQQLRREVEELRGQVRRLHQEEREEQEGGEQREKERPREKEAPRR